MTGETQRENNPEADREKANMMVLKHIEILSERRFLRARSGAGWTYTVASIERGQDLECQPFAFIANVSPAWAVREDMI